MLALSFEEPIFTFYDGGTRFASLRYGPEAEDPSGSGMRSRVYLQYIIISSLTRVHVFQLGFILPCVHTKSVVIHRLSQSFSPHY